MYLVDTHCHIDVPEFDADRDRVLANCQGLGIGKIVVPAIAADSWDRLMGICASSPLLYPALGLHPVLLDHHRPEHVQDLEAAIEKYRPVAVGEIGLDFHLRELDRAAQFTFFERQLDVAQAYGLPVLLHVRKAHDQVLGLLKKRQLVGGICHAFNGSLQQAQQYLALGFKLGFGGMLTYEHSRHLRLLAKELPLEAMVLESDAPDMAGALHRGERNSPEYLPESLAVLAEVREEDAETIAAQTTANAEAILDLA